MFDFLMEAILLGDVLDPSTKRRGPDDYLKDKVKYKMLKLLTDD